MIITITLEHHISQARIAAKELAKEIGFETVKTHYLITSVSELANNIFFHTPRGGKITFNVIKKNGTIGIEVIAEDEGPGIPDIELALQDGFSTNKGLGGGLPGVNRLMDEFEITSEVGTGTRIVSRKWQNADSYR